MGLQKIRQLRKQRPLRVGSSNLKWIFLDENRSTLAAGAVNGTTTSDGKAKRAVTDTESKVTGDGTGIVFAGGKAVAEYGDPGIWYTDTDDSEFSTPVGSLAYFKTTFTATNQYLRLGIDADLAGVPTHQLHFNNNATFGPRDSGDTFIPVSTYSTSEIQTAIAYLSTRTHFLQKINGQWCLIWPMDDIAPESTANISVANYSHALSAGAVGLLSLTANGKPQWGAAFDKVTDTKTNPATDSLVDCPADHSYTISFTVEDGKFVNFLTRRGANSNDYGLRFQVQSNRKPQISERPGGDIGDYAVLYQGSALTDATSYTFDMVCSGSSAKLYIDKVLVAAVATSGNYTVAQAEIEHDLVSNDIEIETHPINLGTATDRVICPQANDTWTSRGDHWLETVISAVPTGGNLQIAFNRQDDNNCWYLDVDSNGKPIVYENVAGSPTARITGSNADVSADDRIRIKADGANVSLFVGTTQIASTYTSRSNFATETSGKILSLGTAGALSELIAWPYNLSTAGLMPRSL